MCPITWRLQDYQQQLMYQQQLATAGGMSNGGFPHQNGGFNGGGAGMQSGGGFHIGSSGTLGITGADNYQQLQKQQQRQQPDSDAPAGFSLSGFSAPQSSAQSSAAAGLHGHALGNGFGTEHAAPSQQQRQPTASSWKQEAAAGEPSERYGATAWPLRDPAPVWGMLTESSQLEAVAAALDERCERDAALLTTLQKR